MPRAALLAGSLEQLGRPRPRDYGPQAAAVARGLNGIVLDFADHVVSGQRYYCLLGVSCADDESYAFVVFSDENIATTVDGCSGPRDRGRSLA